MMQGGCVNTVSTPSSERMQPQPAVLRQSGGVEDAEQLNQLPRQEFAEPPSELGLLLGAYQIVKAEILVSV